MPFFGSRDVLVEGHCAEGFEQVRDAFIANFEKGLEGGAAFVAYVKGEPVVDLWGGYKNERTKEPWKEDTMTMIMSATKGLCAICLAMLADQGRLDYNAPVAKYWPEFAQKGKEKITVKMLLSHQAGLVQFDSEDPSFQVDLDFLSDPQAVGVMLARQEPLWLPGTAHGYHAGTIGSFMDQLIRRIDPNGRSAGQFFSQEIAQPLDLDLHLGLPVQQQSRVAYTRYKPGQSFPGILMKRTFWNYMKISVQRNSLFNKSSREIQPITTEAVSNSSKYQEIEYASGNGIGTARSLAKLYGVLANGGRDLETGKEVLTQTRIHQFNSPIVDGQDCVNLTDNSFSLGCQILNIEDSREFGHFGFGGQFAFADRRRNMSWCYLTNRLVIYGSPTDDPRAMSVRSALLECVDKAAQ